MQYTYYSNGQPDGQRNMSDMWEKDKIFVKRFKTGISRRKIAVGDSFK